MQCLVNVPADRDAQRDHYGTAVLERPEEETKLDDGGNGDADRFVMAAAKALADCGVDDVAVCGLAKRLEEVCRYCR